MTRFPRNSSQFRYASFARSTIYRLPNTLARALSKFADRICIHRREARGSRRKPEGEGEAAEGHLHRGTRFRARARASTVSTLSVQSSQRRKSSTERNDSRGKSERSFPRFSKQSPRRVTVIATSFFGSRTPDEDSKNPGRIYDKRRIGTGRRATAVIYKRREPPHRREH